MRAWSYATDRLLVPAQFIQGNPFEDPAFCIIDFQREEPVTGIEGFFVPPDLGKRGGFIVERIGIRGFQE